MRRSRGARPRARGVRAAEVRSCARRAQLAQAARRHAVRCRARDGGGSEGAREPVGSAARGGRRVPTDRGPDEAQRGLTRCRAAAVGGCSRATAEDSRDRPSCRRAPEVRDDLVVGRLGSARWRRRSPPRRQGPDIGRRRARTAISDAHADTDSDTDADTIHEHAHAHDSRHGRARFTSTRTIHDSRARARFTIHEHAPRFTSTTTTPNPSG